MNAQQSKGFQNFFKGNPEATVKDNCTHSSLTISGDTAQWACTETTTVKSGGKLQGSFRPIRFSFVKNSGAWSISDRQ
jgi:phage-related protein